jgi:hypothetical protein
MATRGLDLKIGEILVEKAVITREQLEYALKEQRKNGADSKKLGSYLIDLGYATEADIATALGMQFNLPVARLDGMKIKPEVIDLVPEKTVKKFNIIPLFKIGDELTTAISDPSDISILDAVGAQTKSKIVPVIAPYLEISKAINKNLKIIMVSALDSLDRVKECMKAGAHHYILKPFEQEKVKEIVERVVRL